MRALFVSALLVPWITPPLQAQLRFTGSSTVSGNAQGVVLSGESCCRQDIGATILLEGEHAPNLSLALPDPTWDIDLTTDGQSVTVNELTVTSSGTVTINPLVSFDITVTATIADMTVDLNPTVTTVWQVARHEFDQLQVSGTYFGLGLTREFSGALPRISGSYNSYSEEGEMDFAQWPNGVTWQSESSSNGSFETRRFGAHSSGGWIGVEPFLHVRYVEFWEPVSIELTPFSEASNPDLDNDGLITGRDFILWQRGPATPANLDAWEDAYAAPPVAVDASTAVPEPMLPLLLVVAIAALSGRRNVR